MKPKISRIMMFVLIGVLILSVSSVYAETVVLKSGKTVEGKIIEKTDKFMKIDFQGIPLTYFLDEVESIDGKPANISNESATLDILNPEYTKPPNRDDDVEITTESTAEDILKKTNYYYSIHDFDKAIELCEIALKETVDTNLIAKINFSLSSNYLQKGIEAHKKNKDYSFYKLSIQFAKKCLEVYPYSWQALANIGSTYFNMEDWKQAVFYFSEAEKYLDKSNPNYVVIETTRSIAEDNMRAP